MARDKSKPYRFIQADAGTGRLVFRPVGASNALDDQVMTAGNPFTFEILEWAGRTYPAFLLLDDVPMPVEVDGTTLSIPIGEWDLQTLVKKRAELGTVCEETLHMVQTGLAAVDAGASPPSIRPGLQSTANKWEDRLRRAHAIRSKADYEILKAEVDSERKTVGGQAAQA